MNGDVQAIMKMLEMDEFDLSLMNEILSHYQDHPAIIPCLVQAGAKIIRSSTNDQNEFHHNVSRLNYPPVQYARTDRASLKGKPMFYASVFTTAARENAFPRIFSAMETTDILRDFNKAGRVFTTQSLWLPDKDLKLFAFPFSKKYKKACEEIVLQRKFWDEDYSHNWSSDYVEFFEFVGDLIAEENYSCLYEITAHTIDYILYQSTASSDLDGIMYPSVWGDGQGMNICLKKESVDKCVHFQEASLQCIDKQVGESFIFGVAESYLLPNGELKWIPTKLAISLLDRTYGIENLLKKGSLIIGNIES